MITTVKVLEEQDTHAQSGKHLLSFTWFHSSYRQHTRCKECIKRCHLLQRHLPQRRLVNLNDGRCILCRLSIMN